MANSQELADFEQVIEKIVFDNNELGTLKIAIKNFTEGKTSAKELKGLLLQCRGRIVEEITAFAFFIVDTQTEEKRLTKNTQDQPIIPTKVESHLIKEIKEKNELLESVAKRVHHLVSQLNTEISPRDLAKKDFH